MGLVDEATPKKTKNKETSAQVEKEEKVGCDFDAPLAMMAGMGEEEVCKVTLIDEAIPEKARNEETSAQVEKEETVGCDVNAPLAMLGGMGEEEVCSVTLMDEATPEAPQPLPPFRRSTQIFVKPITGKTITVKVDSSDTILDLKKMLHSRLSIPTFHQRLIFCGRQLQDTHTISKCRIRKESNLHMVAVLRGGMQAADDEESSAITRLKAVLAEKEKALAEKEKSPQKKKKKKKKKKKS